MNEKILFTKRGPTKILVLSDLHVGSSYGLLPPDFVDSEGNVHSQNKGQAWLWEKYIQTLDKAQPQGIKNVIINGDILDGNKFTNKGQMLTLYLLEDQKAAAIKVLEEVKARFPDANIFFVTGTPSHEVREQVKDIAAILTGTTQHVARTITLDFDGVLIRFHHEVAFRSGQLKASAIEGEINNGLTAVVDAEWDRVDAEVRSHCHYFVALQRRHVFGLVTPCFQLATDFMTKGSPTKNIPDIGGVILTTDPSLKQYGACPVSYTEYLYSHPQPAVTVVSSEDEF